MMDGIVDLALDDRRALFSETASRRGMTEAVVEKDFWVCYVLQKLCESDKLADKLRFKGGTSLSKVFGVIDRFSEDIDLVLSWETLTDKDPFEERSRTQQQRFLIEVREKARNYIAVAILPDLRGRISAKCNAVIDGEDAQTINITYPKTFESEYLRPEIKLEIGPVALGRPCREYTIRSFASEEFPDRFESPECTPKVISAERTFWEKALILHQEAHRTEEVGEQPLRYSRHYYDLMRLAQSEIKRKALKDIALLESVVDFSSRFFPRAWARYDLAGPPTFCLLPPEPVERMLRADYSRMLEMIYGERPAFDEILESLENLEDEINAQKEIG